MMSSVQGLEGNVQHSPVSAQKKKKENRKQQQICDQKLNAFEFRRQAVVSKLQRMRNMMETAEDITVHHLETYLRRVDSCYDEYNSIQNEIYAEFPDQRTEQESAFIEFELLYEELRVTICASMDALRMKQIQVVPKAAIAEGGENQQTIVNQSLGLPHVPLPTFDGTYEKWFRYKQLFQDLMRKYPHLSDATKLHYLTQTLKGKAENVLSEQILNENNFQPAWNILEERFENKRTIIDIHVGGLLNLRRMNKESSSELRQLVEECSRHVESLEFHDQLMQGMSEQLVISLLTSKLDKATLSLWEGNVQPKQLPNYKDTVQFLQNRCFVLERCETNASHKPSEVAKQKQLVPVAKATVKVHAALQTKENVCVFCDESHNVNKCNTLKQMTVPERIVAVKEKHLCFNCLKRGHRVGQCKSRMCTVAGCGRKHHTQLHSEITTEKAVADGNAAESTKEEPVETGQSTSVTCTSAVVKSQAIYKKEVILSTAIVQVKDSRGEFRPVRVLLDSGSQSNFLSEHAVNLLRLKCENIRVGVVGINGEKLTVTQQTMARVKSSYGDASWVLEFLVVPQVTGILPLQKIDIRQWEIPPNIKLADPRFNISAKVDMLIGAELFFDLLITDRMKLDNGQPMLWRSELGWIVCGSRTSIKRPSLVAVAHYISSEASLENAVQRFWKQEEVPEVEKLTSEFEQCIDHFEKTHRRENGRFVVRLPFRDTVKLLGNSRSLAERRFLQLERKFVHQPELKKQYVTFINEYVSLGHCRKLENDDDTVRGYYLPHHAILKPSSSTTKLRVVFDASARSDTNLSLNDVLITGPIVQDSLMAIVLRFRKYKYVFTADILKMYRQIQVDDRDLADEEQSEFPIASQVIKKDFYMDDVLSGADSLQAALECQDQLIASLKRGGFKLHKWCANDKQERTNPGRRT
ncbi:uncharacterized protein LOC131433952 [Malaya genurostris]|uniref:uncharacterized protein LOC131433952 n=1 Tax=Malaya genurostris TaxID=325434 RepID=UPI0026F385A9|nr:uncharacterized protein LOC131433952 [Malaya genurostris]